MDAVTADLSCTRKLLKIKAYTVSNGVMNNDGFKTLDPSDEWIRCFEPAKMAGRPCLSSIRH
jgi:hypothetical protein